MRVARRTFLALALAVVLGAGVGASEPPQRYRMIVLADMGNEPDEMQQMIHLFACSNLFEVQGLIAVTGKYLHPESDLSDYHRRLHPELWHEIIDAYADVLPNLRQHADGWATPDHFRGVVRSGQTGYGIADVGEGKASPGSELILAAATRDDDRPLWVVVNAGSNTLAQALDDYRREHDAEEVAALVAKLRVYENGSQDNAGAWICHEFPDIHWVRSNFQTYAYGGPGWADKNAGLGPHDWQPHANSTVGQLAWQREHIMTDHGALGALYPERKFHPWGEGVVGFMEGGGTAPWMGLVNQGLFDINEPSWGGWGGRFSRHKVKNFWSRHADIRADEERVAPFFTYREVSDTWTHPESGEVYHNDYAPVWRWRKAMYHDFINRMDWCVRESSEANHHPVAVVDGDATDLILRRTVVAGSAITLDASASHDPDGDTIRFRWWVYTEAGTYALPVQIHPADEPVGMLVIPVDAAGKQIHLILEVEDVGAEVSLFDYRRIVFDVSD